MSYLFAVIFILSIILNIILLKIVLSSYVGLIHKKDGVVWIELSNEDSLNRIFGIVIIKKSWAHKQQVI